MFTRISCLLLASLVASAAGAQVKSKSGPNVPGMLRFNPQIMGSNRTGDTFVLRGEFVPATPELARNDPGSTWDYRIALPRFTASLPAVPEAAAR